jgi:hypothetical protein
VEAERLRPGLNELLLLADYVVTSTKFPEVTEALMSAWNGPQVSPVQVQREHVQTPGYYDALLRTAHEDNTCPCTEDGVTFM